MKSYEKKLVYNLGVDFSKEEYDKWIAQIALWLQQIRKHEENPVQKARNIVDAAINGTKLDGSRWLNIENMPLDKRIGMLSSGWDILIGRGHKPSQLQDKTLSKAKADRKSNVAQITELDHEDMIRQREEYKAVLLTEFPHLDSPVYTIKVNAYADTVIQMQRLSEGFLAARDSELKKILSLRDSLKKDLDDFMKLLRIHPSQIKEKIDEGDRGDVGSLINKWESYGELSEMYEVVDAVQEALQIIQQLENVRVDGSPQLADWLLWHKTGCRGHDFTCEHGIEYKLHGGFTKEEMYAIAEQAFKTFGYGIKPVEKEDLHEGR